LENDSLAETIFISPRLVVDAADTLANVQREYCLKYSLKRSEL